MRGLNALDIVVIIAYLLGITLLGIWVGRRQRDAKDYFVADREIPWWAVMFSIVASETSALTFISIPGLAYIGNLGFLEIATGYLVGRIVLAYTLLPRYYEGNLVTAVYLFGGAAAVVLVGHLVTGGWSAILATAGAAHKLQIISWYTGFDQPHTVFAGVLGGAFLSMASHGADQLIVQRLLSARSLKAAQAAVIGSGVAVIIQFALFLILGIGLWALYGGRTFPIPDSIFPTFIVDKMPHGLVGLLLAAVLAATMSTHSGAINSLAAASTHDIYLPITGLAPDDPRTLRMGRIFALVWGIILTAGALLFHANAKTPVVVVALSIASFTYGGLLGGFFLAIFWARARQRDAILGMSVGIAVMSVVVFAKQIIAAFPGLAHALGPVSTIAYPWFVLIGTVITLTVGIVSSFTHPRSAPLPAELAPST